MEAIMAEHETALLRYATRIVNSSATAQDVVQNVFIRLFQTWQENTRPSRHLKGWLYRVTHNEAVDAVRRETRRRGLHERHAEQQKAECPDGVHCGDPTVEQRRLVLENVRRLDEPEQQVLLLRLEEGLSYAEIAEITGRTEGNVGNILHHAVKKMTLWLTPKPAASTLDTRHLAPDASQPGGAL
jgi:RNA polymerase sigma-70 factor (ECF subfamily)